MRGRLSWPFWPVCCVSTNIEMGIGSTVVAADAARDAFFVADARFANTGGVGLFHVSASALLNPTTTNEQKSLLYELGLDLAERFPDQSQM